MSKKSRLEELKSYDLFDTPPEKELDEITELASVIFGTPISLITLLDDKRQWFKSNKGLDQNETKIEDSFCQHTLHKPNEILVVNDALKDQRFFDNKLVLDDPNIRFYAGAPLVTQDNHVLGTLCVIDKKPKEINQEQKNALQILARRVMDKFETRRALKELNTTIESNAARLIKITENLPFGIFELKVNSSGDLEFLFLSEGMKKIHPEIDLDQWFKNPELGFSLLHPDDIEPFKISLNNSVKNKVKLYHEYRVTDNSDSGYRWHAVTGQPEKTENGETIIYGSFIDVTHHVEYEAALEQISSDISHVLRRPVTSMLGITKLLESDQELSAEKLREYSGYIKTIANELDKFTRKLNEVYSEKKHILTSNSNRH